MGSSNLNLGRLMRGEYMTSEVMKECEKHGNWSAIAYSDNGEIVGHRPSGCPACVEDERAKEKQREVEQAVMQQIDKAKIPLRFAACELDTYQPTAANAEAYKLIRGYAARWPEQCKTGESLVLIGQVGTGKTHLAVGLLKHAIRKGKAGRYCTVAELLREIRATWKGQGDRTEAQMVEYFGSLPLLVLDEIGATYGTDGERVILFDVLNERYERMLPTIVCGNVSPEEMAKCLDERVVDRLRENGGRAAIFTGASHRRAA